MALGDPIAFADLTPDFLKKNYLTGLSFCDATGQELGDEFFCHHMNVAMRKLQDITQISVMEEAINAEPHDYYINDYTTYAFLQLFKWPVLSVEQVRAVYPAGQTIQVFPNEWVRLTVEHGQIHLVPSRGTLGQIIIGQGGDYLPLIYSGLTYLPALWEVDYTVGFDQDDIPPGIAEAIMKLASVEILTIASDLIRPLGVTSESVSMDGLSQSQSYTVPAFQQRINRYIFDLYGIEGKNQTLKTTSGLLRQLHDQYHGFTLASV
jgi:hypothetical protein